MSGFDEPDDVERIDRVLAYRVARAQAFGEGNKRTAVLLARWVLDRNGKNGALLIPADDRDLADLLVRAAAGTDVESEIIVLLQSRE